MKAGVFAGSLGISLVLSVSGCGSSGLTSAQVSPAMAVQPVRPVSEAPDRYRVQQHTMPQPDTPPSDWDPKAGMRRRGMYPGYIPPYRATPGEIREHDIQTRILPGARQRLREQLREGERRHARQRARAEAEGRLRQGTDTYMETRRAAVYFARLHQALLSVQAEIRRLEARLAAEPHGLDSDRWRASLESWRRIEGRIARRLP